MKFKIKLKEFLLPLILFFFKTSIPFKRTRKKLKLKKKVKQRKALKIKTKLLPVLQRLLTSPLLSKLRINKSFKL